MGHDRYLVLDKVFKLSSNGKSIGRQEIFFRAAASDCWLVNLYLLIVD